ADLAGAVTRLLSDPAKATGSLRAIANRGVLDRLSGAAAPGEPVLEPAEVVHPDYAEATVRTPAVVRLEADGRAVDGREHCAPISFLIGTAGTEGSLRLLRETVAERGALTASGYSTSPEVLEAAEEAAADAGVNLSE